MISSLLEVRQHFKKLLLWGQIEFVVLFNALAAPCHFLGFYTQVLLFYSVFNFLVCDAVSPVISPNGVER